jgi:hypothetical protein
MTNEQRPLTGGSYIRNKDGSLKRTGGTADAEPAAPSTAAAASDTSAPAEGSDTSKKGK